MSCFVQSNIIDERLRERLMSLELKSGDVINERYRIERPHPAPDQYLRYFLARDLMLQRVVIIKVAAITTHERFMKRFRQEARVLAGGTPTSL